MKQEDWKARLIEKEEGTVYYITGGKHSGKTLTLDTLMKVVDEYDVEPEGNIDRLDTRYFINQYFGEKKPRENSKSKRIGRFKSRRR